MDEILTSIRRLIAQDQALFAADLPSGAPSGQAQEPDASATGAVAVQGLRQAIEAEFGAQLSSAGHDFTEAPERPGALRSESTIAMPLTSPQTDASAAAAFNALVAARFAQNPDAVMALTRDALRPLLKAWLEAHLPALVERLVSAEIKRIASGR
jgi:cell pole-organizing protein PopZ